MAVHGYRKAVALTRAKIGSDCMKFQHSSPATPPRHSTHSGRLHVHAGSRQLLSFRRNHQFTNARQRHRWRPGLLGIHVSLTQPLLTGPLPLVIASIMTSVSTAQSTATCNHMFESSVPTTFGVIVTSPCKKSTPTSNSDHTLTNDPLL